MVRAGINKRLIDEQMVGYLEVVAAEIERDIKRITHAKAAKIISVMCDLTKENPCVIFETP